MTRRPWRVEGDAQHKTKIATQSDQVVSVAQLESSTLGLVAQCKGILTTQRYKYVLIFVDQFSDLTFVFLQKRLTSKETVLAKKTFERYASIKGVRIQHYHEDNGCFADKVFVNHCQEENQTLTYYGVNAHFQNGVAEKKIKLLQEKIRTCLVYAMNKWPRMIIANLWPYTLRHVNDVANAIPIKVNKSQHLRSSHQYQ